MTEPLSQYAPVRLLIAEISENDAHACDSLLRDAGIATRTRVVDLPMALASVNEADLLVANSELPGLQQLLPDLIESAPDLPVILVNNQTDTFTTTAGLKLGAADVVPRSDPDRLVLVIKRELENISRAHLLSQTRRALAEAEQRCQLLMDSSHAAVAYVHEGMHIHANAGYLELFGIEDAGDLPGLPLMDLLDQHSADTLKSALKKFRNDGEQTTLEFTGQSTQGGALAGSLTLSGAEYEGETCIQVTIQAAPAKGAKQEKVAEATQSSVPAAAPTASNNLLPMTEFLGVVGSMEGGSKAIFTAEVDHFSSLQREYGIAGAAEIARHAEHSLREALKRRPLTQLSGHQWAFPVTGTDRDDIMTTAENLSTKLGTLMLEVGGKTVRPTLSLGGASLDAHASDRIEANMNQAFATLRSAMDEGESQCVAMHAPAPEKHHEHLEPASPIMRLINEAIQTNSFKLLFQPIISLRGDADEHYEVFLRMATGEDGGHMTPSEFLRTAVDNGVADKIDRWVVLQSIKQLVVHRAKGNDTRLTINLTCTSVNDPAFLQWLGVAIKAARLPSDAVIFQITEQDASTYPRETRKFMEGLNKMHYRTSLSRLGLGSKSMELVGDIPTDFVKLDGENIQKMGKDPRTAEAVAQTVTDLQGAGKLTIVPMVESAKMLSALWQAGANYVQGQYLQEPTESMDYDFSVDG